MCLLSLIISTYARCGWRSSIVGPRKNRCDDPLIELRQTAVNESRLSRADKPKQADVEGVRAFHTEVSQGRPFAVQFL